MPRPPSLRPSALGRRRASVSEYRAIVCDRVSSTRVSFPFDLSNANLMPRTFVIPTTVWNDSKGSGDQVNVPVVGKIADVPSTSNEVSCPYQKSVDKNVDYFPRSSSSSECFASLHTCMHHVRCLLGLRK